MQSSLYHVWCSNTICIFLGFFGFFFFLYYFHACWLCSFWLAIAIKPTNISYTIFLFWSDSHYLLTCLDLVNSIRFSSGLLSPLTVLLCLFSFCFQRCRYVEAYQIDNKLRSLEQNFFQTASEEEVSKIRSISQWREGLIVSISWFQCSAYDFITCTENTKYQTWIGYVNVYNLN